MVELEKMKLQELVDMVNYSLPDYVAQRGGRWAYICRNNGQFHRGHANGMGGWATYLGRYDKAGVIFLLRNGYLPYTETE